jgi:protein tyrosine phosphatase
MYELIETIKPKTNKTPNGEMMFELGDMKTMIMGGPFEYYHDHLSSLPNFTGVLMAAELEHMDHAIFIPTQDFQTPDETMFRLGLVQSIARIQKGELIYVGCMGGIGRTGLFMAGLAKVMGVKDVIAHVRNHYLPTAVETQQQQDYINNLYLEDIAKWARML